MRSVADALKREERATLAALTPSERVALALQLGARDLDAYRLTRVPPLSTDHADRLLRRQRQRGRRPSRCVQELIG